MRRSVTILASAAAVFTWVVVKGGGIGQVASLAKGSRHLIRGRGHHLIDRYPEAGPASATGPLERYGYGEIQVEAFVANHRLQKIQVVKFEAVDTYSIELEQYAVPRLDVEALRADGLPIQVVSGATYTSEGYALSLQGALDKLVGK